MQYTLAIPNEYTWVKVIPTQHWFLPTHLWFELGIELLCNKLTILMNINITQQDKILGTNLK